MELMCPQCHTANRVSAERAAGPVLCSGCETQFEVVLSGGVLETVLSPGADVAAEDILNIPFEAFADSPADHPAGAVHAQVLEDVFAAPEPFEAHAEVGGQRAALLSADAPHADAADPLHVTEPAAVSAPAHAAQPEREATPRPAPVYDKYAVGMRVLRISPAWLLLSSVGFFLVLLGLSWMSKPVGEVSAATGAVMPNQASATSATPAARRANEALRPAEPEPTAAPVEKPAPAEEKKSAPAEAPKPAPAEATKPSEAPAAGGKFTVQVGSFNNP